MARNLLELSGNFILSGESVRHKPLRCREKRMASAAPVRNGIRSLRSTIKSDAATPLCCNQRYTFFALDRAFLLALGK
jgi:hypothetical protein